MIDGLCGWNAPIWFLLVLFWIELIGWSVFKLDSELINVVAIVILLIIWNLISKKGIIIPLGFHLVPIGLAFWLCGYNSGKNKIFEKISVVNKARKLILTVILAAINFIFGILLSGTISVYHNIYYNRLFSIIAGMSAIGMWSFVLSFLKDCGEKKVLEKLQFFGKNTKMILYSHYFILMAIRMISARMIGVDLWHYQSSVKSLGFTFVIMILYEKLIPEIKSLKKEYSIIRLLM